jgi:hypothetical protein
MVSKKSRSKIITQKRVSCASASNNKKLTNELSQ